MTKPTPSDKLLASGVVQRLINNYLAKHGSVEAEGVIAELNRIHDNLLKADERLLQPKPKQSRKPQPRVQVAAAPVVKATFEPDASRNPNERTGRNSNG